MTFDEKIALALSLRNTLGHPNGSGVIAQVTLCRVSSDVGSTVLDTTMPEVEIDRDDYRFGSRDFRGYGKTAEEALDATILLLKKAASSAAIRLSAEALIATKKSQALAALAMPIGGDDIPRCEVCDWPLAADERNCVPGNCAYRPGDPAEQERIRRRREEIQSRKDAMAAVGP